MFRFLEFLFARLGHPPQVYQRARQRLRSMSEEGLSREHTNRAYFTNLQDLRADVVRDVAGDWFAAELSQGGLFNQAVLRALQGHRQDGDLVVLVSGSYPACLGPLAGHVGADVVLCSTPEIDDGRYTGRVSRPMIGPEKAAAVRELAERYGLTLAGSTAYGDHISDRELLTAVGTPVAVGANPVLVEHARSNGWRVLEEPVA